MTSFVYKYTVMMPMPIIITRICFFWQECAVLGGSYAVLSRTVLHHCE